MLKVDMCVKTVLTVIAIPLVVAITFSPMLNASAEAGRAGPFGFEAGMSVEEVKKMVGEENVTRMEEWEGDVFRIGIVPRPHPLFESYLLYFCPKRGLVKLIAMSKPIHTSVYGTELKKRFEITIKK